MSEDEALLDSRFGAYKSYVFGLAANSPARASMTGFHPYVTMLHPGCVVRTRFSSFLDVADFKDVRAG
jgi:hypothetical protein